MGATITPFRNSEVLVASAGTTVTFYVDLSGTDTDTAKYLNLGRPANNWTLRTDKDITIDKINGVDITPSPITLTALASFSKIMRSNSYRLTSITVTTQAASTNLRLYVDTW